MTPERIRTHWDTCYRVHHDCAIVRVDQLLSENAEQRSWINERDKGIAEQKQRIAELEAEREEHRKYRKQVEEACRRGDFYIPATEWRDRIAELEEKNEDLTNRLSDSGLIEQAKKMASLEAENDRLRHIITEQAIQMNPFLARPEGSRDEP